MSGKFLLALWLNLEGAWSHTRKVEAEIALRTINLHLYIKVTKRLSKLRELLTNALSEFLNQNSDRKE